MQKILQLGVKDWITGIGVGQHLEGTGIFSLADGINPFVNPLLDSGDFGLLQTGKTAVDASASVVDQVIVSFTPRVTGASEGTMYALGISGDIYSINMNTNAPTLASARGVSMQNGWISKAGGIEYFYYINSGTQIGRYDLASDYANNWNTALQNTTIHPVHYWQKTHWIGDKDRISKVNSTPAVTANVLAFDPEYTVMCLSDDDYRLVIGVATQITSITYRAITKVYFWDGASTLPEKMWEIPEANIQWIKRLGSLFYANCGRALYAFNYATPPTKIIDLDSNHSTAVGNYNATDRLGDAVLWGSVAVNMYGKLNTRIPTTYSTPFSFALGASSVASLNASAKSGTIYLGGADSKLYTISTTTGGDTNGLIARTHFIDLKDVYNIQGVTVIFGTNLASGDDLTITLTNRNTDSQAISPTFAALGAIARQFFPVSLKADQLQISIGAFNGGNPKIKDIIIYGEKTSEL